MKTFHRHALLPEGGVPCARGVPGPRGYLVLGGVPCPGGVPGPGGAIPGPRGCTWSQGVYLVRGGTCPGTPPVWTESQTPVKI